MEFLVIFAGLCTVATHAVSLESGYGEPAAPVVVIQPKPIEQVTIPLQTPFVEPQAVAIRQFPTPPLAHPTPLRSLSPIPFPLAPRTISSFPAVAPGPLPGLPAPFAAGPVPVAPRAPLNLVPAAPRSPLNLVNAAPRAPLNLAPAIPRAPLNLSPATPRAPLSLAPSTPRAPLNLVPAAPRAPLNLVPAAPAPISHVPSPLALAASPAPLPVAPSSQFHAQDELGGFSFGYQNQNSAKKEVRLPNGVTRGSYSYVDANGIPQQVEYIADPINGFRVAATNLPIGPNVPVVGAAAPLAAGPVAVSDTPEVVAAKADFQRAYDEAVARNAKVPEAAAAENAVTTVLRKKRSALNSGYGIPAAPIVAIPAPVVQVTRTVTPVTQVISEPLRVAAPVVPLAPRAPFGLIPHPVTAVRSPLPAGPIPFPAVHTVHPLAAATVVPATATSSQFQAQDELGGFSFGYQNINSARQESRTPDGVTRGSYSYVDANGIPQTVNYIADALGYRVTGTNLPVAPIA